MTFTSSSQVRDRIQEFIRVPAGQLKPHPHNWRIHSTYQRSILEGLLASIGYADALIARRDGEELVLIDGHLRQSLDPEQVVPVLVLDVDEQEAETLLLTLDPLAGLARPDSEAVSDLLARAKTSSEAVAGFLEDIRREAGIAAAALIRDPDEVPEVTEPICQPGDLWQLGEHRLLCGDATDPSTMGRLMDGTKAQVMWTDPPYGVDYVGKTEQALKIQGDTSQGLEELLARAFKAASPVLEPGAPLYMCHPAGRESLKFLNAFVQAGWRLHQGLVWVKDTMVLGHADYHYRHEPIAFGYVPGEGRQGRGGSGWHGGNSQDSVLEVARPKASREHPTMKPVELIRRCLANSSKQGDAVLDPFAGSGSTLIACQLLGRRAFAVELDPQYCDVILRRFETVSGVVPTNPEGMSLVAERILGRSEGFRDSSDI